MRILADQHIHYLDQLIPSYAEIVHYDSSEGIPRLEGFDAWILRTVTKVNPKTVPSLPEKLKFIGSASAGTDHIDREYLSDNGIQFDHSPGCNANAVAEYVLTSMLTWCSSTRRELSNHKVGIIGMGHTGGALAKKLDAIGVSYAGYDPPKALREESFMSCHLDTLKDCDILSFHLPYIDQGRYPTHHFMPDILSLTPKELNERPATSTSVKQSGSAMVRVSVVVQQIDSRPCIFLADATKRCAGPWIMH